MNTLCFRLGGVRVLISFWFLAGLTLFALMDRSFIVLSLLLAIVFHEGIHIFFLLYFGARIHSLELRIYGVRLDCELSLLSGTQKTISFLAAPLLNLITGGALYLLDPSSIFGALNLCIGIFNLLPIPPLDGGNAAAQILSAHPHARTFFRHAAQIYLIPLFAAAVWLCLYRHNMTLLLCGIYLLLSLYLKK